MTLLRQLLIAILALMSVVLAGSLAISVVHTRDYLDAQLRSHAQDAATSLGLSLSTSAAEDDRATMEAMVDALFDSGYYRAVRVVDTEGRTLVHRVQSGRFNDVPAWFVRLLPLPTPRGEALLMSGWRQLGQVEVTSNPGYAYLELWRTTRDSAGLFALPSRRRSPCLACTCCCARCAPPRHRQPPLPTASSQCRSACPARVSCGA